MGQGERNILCLPEAEGKSSAHFVYTEYLPFHLAVTAL